MKPKSKVKATNKATNKAKAKATTKAKPKSQRTTSVQPRVESAKTKASASNIAKRKLIRSWRADCKKIIAGNDPSPVKRFIREPGESFRDTEGPVFGSWLDICNLSVELESEVRSRNLEAAKMLIESAIHLTTAISRLARDGNKSICRAASHFTEIPVMCGPHPDSLKWATQMIELTRTGTKAQMAVAPQMKNEKKIKFAFTNSQTQSQSYRARLGEYVNRAYSCISNTRSVFRGWKGDIPDLAKSSLNLSEQIWTWKELAWNFILETHVGVPSDLSAVGFSCGEKYKRESSSKLNPEAVNSPKLNPEAVKKQQNKLAKERFYGAWVKRYKQPAA